MSIRENGRARRGNRASARRRSGAGPHAEVRQPATITRRLDRRATAGSRKRGTTGAEVTAGEAPSTTEGMESGGDLREVVRRPGVRGKRIRPEAAPEAGQQDPVGRAGALGGLFFLVGDRGEAVALAIARLRQRSTAGPSDDGRMRVGLVGHRSDAANGAGGSIRPARRREVREAPEGQERDGFHRPFYPSVRRPSDGRPVSIRPIISARSTVSIEYSSVAARLAGPWLFRVAIP